MVSRATRASTRLTQSEAKKLMANAPEEKIFWSHDGQTFRNLRDMAKGLMHMTDETYSYHVNGSKNDFANWVKWVIGDEDMARDLEKTMSRLDAAKIVDARVNYLSSLR